MNPINKKDSKSFQYAVTVALNYDKIKKDPHKITKIKTFIYKYIWQGKIFQWEGDDWKNFEKNNGTIALNVLYTKQEKIYPAYVSKTKIVKNKLFP